MRILNRSITARSARKVVALSAAAAVTLLAAAGCNNKGSSSASGGSGKAGACDPKQVHLVQSGRGFENPYYVAVDAGAKAFAKSVGLENNYTWIASEGDSSKQLTQIQSLLAKYGKCTVLNVDPNDNSILPAIVTAVQRQGAWLVTQWNKPDGTGPTKSSEHWVSHMSVDGNPQGYNTAKALFQAMGGQGNIVALQGILDNVPAKQRFDGLQKALKEFPNVHLLDNQTANWDQTQGQNVTQTFLTKYGDKINGVWAANDSMALGAVEALKAAGKAGTVKVSGIDGLQQAIDDVKAGNVGYAATTQSTGAAQGGYGLAIGYAAATGKINPAKESAEHRAFYLKFQGIVSADNAATLPPPTDTSKLDFSDVWSCVESPITEG
ncbi:sugar ABC transporter substrate-binding protein [Planosporangium thailandense]|uniref:Sugar ABC transporter substrate-binding protein n=1 Tax=Planosporangium thailandense TaxID=765197 RepID=A0ABX0Y837_9ACTN|nr:sugar ABC transporter substrate-binding protein [Planosporangium thailandense]NJC73434.1 sugar ABC transporter substrate-binding protein [Planosporangium thailandense]